MLCVNNCGKTPTTSYVVLATPEKIPAMKLSKYFMHISNNNILLWSWPISFAAAWNTGYIDDASHHPNGILLKNLLLMWSHLLLILKTQIGWDQFFHGHLSKDWIQVIKIYYHDHWPGTAFNLDQWACTTISALWNFSMTLWHQCCKSYHHGVNGIHTLERKCKATAVHAVEVYQETIGTVTPMENILLHWHSLNTMMNWTKQHLDAYLTTTEVLCEWNVEPG